MTPPSTRTTITTTTMSSPSSDVIMLDESPKKPSPAKKKAAAPPENNLSISQFLKPVEKSTPIKQEATTTTELKLTCAGCGYALLENKKDAAVEKMINHRKYLCSLYAHLFNEPVAKNLTVYRIPSSMAMSLLQGGLGMTRTRPCNYKTNANSVTELVEFENNVKFALPVYGEGSNKAINTNFSVDDRLVYELIWCMQCDANSSFPLGVRVLAATKDQQSFCDEIWLFVTSVLDGKQPATSRKQNTVVPPPTQPQDNALTQPMSTDHDDVDNDETNAIMPTQPQHQVISTTTRPQPSSSQPSPSSSKYFAPPLPPAGFVKASQLVASSSQQAAPSAAPTFYVVTKGFVPGVYTSWTTFWQQVNKYEGAEYKRFASLDAANTYFEDCQKKRTFVNLVDDNSDDTENTEPPRKKARLE